MALDFKKLSDPEYKREYQETQEALAKELEKEEKEYSELINDASKSPKLTEWESNFIRNLRRSMNTGGATRFSDLSIKQQEVLKKIKGKIYAIG